MFRLNMTEFEIRRQIREDSKDDKVHRKKDISVNNDLKDENKKSAEYEKKEKSSNKRYITIEAKKNQEITIEAEKDEANNRTIPAGIYIDKME